MEPALLGPVAVLVVVLVVLPVAACSIARIGGWRALAERYPAHEPMPRPRRWLGHAVFRGWVGYNGALVVASDARGLYFRTWPLLLPWCHPPIFIPWTEVEAIVRSRHRYGALYEIRTRRAAGVRFGLRERTFRFVRDDAARARVAGDYR